MFTDKKLLWALEYALGFTILAIAMPLIVTSHPNWSDAHGWAYLLFLASCAFILISCASAMRQRMQLAQRIAKLEQTADYLKPAQKQAQNESGQKHTVSQQFVGSVN